MILIAQNIIVFLSLTTACVALFLAYLGVVAKVDRAQRSALIKPAHLLVFFTMTAAVLAASNHLVVAGRLGPSLAVLAGGFFLCSLIYFRFFRPENVDDRAKYAMVLLVSVALLSGIALFLLWWFGERFEFPPAGELLKIQSSDLMQLLAAAAQMLGVIVAAAMIVVTNAFNARQAERTSRQQIYQTLELQAVSLFRFETGRGDLVGQLWVDEADGGTPPKDAIAEYQLSQYICQFLNLFEMAFRFRKEDVVEHQVFGSWVIWMWSLCERAPFRERWKGDMRMNYVPDFRAVIDEGVRLCDDLARLPRKTSAETRRMKADAALEAFFRHMAQALDGCPAVLAWLDDRKRASAAA